MRLPLALSIAVGLLAAPLLAAHWAAPQDRTTTEESSTPERTTTTRDDLERAARDFRIAVYRNFRRNRPEFDRRNAVWRDIHAQWQRDGEPDDDLPALVDWLRRATDASRQGATRPLPLPPEFGATANSVVPPRGATQSPRVATQSPGQSPDKPRVFEPPTAEPPVPPLARRDADASPSTRRADASTLPDVALPISPSLPPPQRAALDIDEPQAAAHEPPRHRSPPLAIDSTATKPELPPADTPVDTPTHTPTETPNHAGRGIDVGEVAIRVAGHNLALATLAEEIGQTDRPSVDQLLGFVERLEALAVRANDLSPYYTLIDAADRGRLRPLASLDEARTLLLARIAEATEAAAADASLPADRRAEQLARLGELALRVKHLAATP